jgi:hypothetical protein
MGRKFGGKYGGTCVGGSVIPPVVGVINAAVPTIIPETNTAPPDIAQKEEHNEPPESLSKTEHDILDKPNADSTSSSRSGGATEELLQAKSWAQAVGKLNGKKIRYVYIVSDSTGFTASHAVTSVMAQFENLIVDSSTDPSPDDNSTELRTQMFHNVQEWARLERIVQLAAKMEAFIVYTLVDKELCSRLTRLCEALGVPYHDVMDPILQRLSDFFGVEPKLLPRGSAGLFAFPPL